MNFKRGSKVEVMNKEVPTSWRVAEILSGNGHTYNLAFDCYPGVEKVSRRFIRPSPPPTKGLGSWEAGDIVEVFDDNSWKTATVLGFSGGNHFLVRVHGLTHEIRVHKSNIRTRQSWQDGRWVPVGKVSGSYGDMKISNIVETNCQPKPGFKMPLADANTYQQEDNFLVVYDDTELQESRLASSKSLKRASPFCSSLLEAKKFKVAEKEGSRRRQSLEKVDAFAYPSEIPAFNNTVNGYYESEKGKSNGVVGSRISESYDSDNDLCSVGSCSVSSDGPYELSSHYQTESFNTSRDEDGNYSPDPREEDVAESIHRLELNAYRSTLEALYASGPLSWEKEALLTNLRISLHISNDEHLTELKHLISPGAGILD